MSSLGSPSEKIINDLVSICKNSICKKPSSNTEEDCEEGCKEIYDLFYGLSLIYKRKFIAREITAGNCNWEYVDVRLGDLVLCTDIDGTQNTEGEAIADIVNNNDYKRNLKQNADKYSSKRQHHVNDPIIVIKISDNKYEILDGNGMALYKVVENGFDVNKEIEAFIGECNGDPKDYCIPYGIEHFLEEFFKQNKI